MNTIQSAKRAACYEAIKNHISSSTKIIGIGNHQTTKIKGSGTTIAWIVPALKELMKSDQNINVIACIPTSFQARDIIISENLPLGDLNQFPDIDVVFDGADEIDKNLNMIKGGGGCHLQEKLVAFHSKVRVFVADESKDSLLLGEKWKNGIPLEIIPCAINATIHSIHRNFVHSKCVIRYGTGKAGPVMSDNGNILVDCQMGLVEDVKGVSDKLKSIPGVVEHGLFYKIADHVYIGKSDGSCYKKLSV